MSECAGHMSSVGGSVGVCFVVCCGCFLYMYVMNKTSALTEVRMPQIVTLHEEGYKERDIAAFCIAPRHRCTMLSSNSVLMARFIIM